MTETENAEGEGPRVVRAASARFAAKIFHYGNIVAMLVPLPLGIFWLGASMLVYAMNRHNPNPRVGHYTQTGATPLYGALGLVVVVATFFSRGLTPWLVLWAVCAVIVIPWSIYQLVQIQREEWHDTPIPAEHDKK